MDRRRLLVRGATLLPLGLAGCLDPGVSTGGDGSNARATTSSTESISTPQSGYEALLVLNDDSASRTVSVTVYRETDGRTKLLDATYEVPSEYILEVPTRLEHGTEYHFEAVLAHGPTEAKTLTPDECGEDSENPDGDRPVVVGIYDAEPSIVFMGCDMLFKPSYTRTSAEKYEVTE